MDSVTEDVPDGGDVLEVRYARGSLVAGALEETADHQGLTVAQPGGGGRPPCSESRDALHLAREVGLAHLGVDGEEDVALVRDARDEVDDGAEGLEGDIGGEAGRDPDRDLAPDL